MDWNGRANPPERKRTSPPGDLEAAAQADHCFQTAGRRARPGRWAERTNSQCHDLWWWWWPLKMDTKMASGQWLEDMLEENPLGGFRQGPRGPRGPRPGTTFCPKCFRTLLLSEPGTWIHPTNLKGWFKIPKNVSHGWFLPPIYVIYGWWLGLPD